MEAKHKSLMISSRHADGKSRHVLKSTKHFWISFPPLMLRFQTGCMLTLQAEQLQ